mgnify:CR=1 FL=1
MKEGLGYLMDIGVLTDYFYKYGNIIIFIIVFLEYANMPGFPSGVIMPLAGIWSSQGNVGFITTMVLSLLAGLCGSWALYFLGRYGGGIILQKYTKRFPKQKANIDQTIDRIKEKGCLGVFASKLIPVLRTVISLPAGVLKINFTGYTIASAAGIFLWNFVFVGAGYIFGESVLEMFM